jgi:8-oxo-dGTP pyrophosphatase MutT (NUDIX family)
MCPSIDSIRKFLESYQRYCYDKNDLIPAGVLVPLLERDDKLYVILTQRTDEVEHHKGQVSFPGGTKDSNDATIIDTALRETEEEIGLKQNSMEVLGLLDDFQTPSGFCMTPVVACIKSLPEFLMNKAEVSEVFDVPLDFFLDSENVRIEHHERLGKMTDIYFYEYEKYEIWGATAAILHNFLNSFIVGQSEDHKKLL